MKHDRDILLSQKNNVHCPKNIPSLKPHRPSHIPGTQMTIHFVVGLSLQLFILLLLLVYVGMHMYDRLYMDISQNDGPPSPNGFQY